MTFYSTYQIENLYATLRIQTGLIFFFLKSLMPVLFYWKTFLKKQVQNGVTKIICGFVLVFLFFV